MGRWVIALVTGAALVAVPAATSEVVVAQTVFHRAALPADAVTGFTVACDPGYFAASAGVSNPATGVTTLGIKPLGLRTYAFRFGNPARNPDRHVTVAVTCRKVRAAPGGAPHFRLTPSKPRFLRLGPASQKRAAIACPKGTVPAGSGYELDTSRPQAVRRFSRLPVRVLRQEQSLRGFGFTLRNDGPKARTARLYGTCMTLVIPPAARREWLHIKVLTTAVQLHQGLQVVSRRCPRSWTAVAAGYALPPSLSLNGAAALNVAARWSLTSNAQGHTLGDLQLVCIRIAAS
jgi:hypothetical protein